MIIPKNTALPARVSRAFVTARADQRDVLVPVVEGESHRPEDCIQAGQVRGAELAAGSARRHDDRGRIPLWRQRVRVGFRTGAHARQSARVEIERELTRNLEDLPTWKARLCGLARPSSDNFAADATTVDPADRSSVVKRLDSLCMKVGLAAVGLKLPEGIEQARCSAAASAADLKRSQKALREAEKQRQAAISTSDIIRLDAALSQARAAVHQAQVKSDFAHVVLGRECVRVAFCPPRLERDLDEIRKWQKHLEQMKA